MLQVSAGACGVVRLGIDLHVNKLISDVATD
jgi:hypothetical protein